jgi:hypothetical protein
MPKRFHLAACLILLAVAAVHVSAANSFQLYDQIIEGTSTAQDVKAILGKPFSTGDTALKPGSDWRSYRKGDFFFVISFNPQGVVVFKMLTEVRKGHSRLLKQTDHPVPATPRSGSAGAPIRH